MKKKYLMASVCIAFFICVLPKTSFSLGLEDILLEEIIVPDTGQIIIKKWNKHGQLVCYSTGFMASADGLDNAQKYIVAAFTFWGKRISMAISLQTIGLVSGVQASANLRAHRKMQHSEIDKKAQEKKEEYDKHTRRLALRDWCNGEPAFHALTKARATIGELNRAMTEDDRNIGQGLKISTYDKDILRGKGAKNAEKKAVIFPTSPLYTESQWQAWNDVRDSFLPQWKNPRPKFTDAHQEARYLTAETKARDARVLVQQAFRVFGNDRLAIVPAKWVLEWANFIEPPTITTIEVDKNGLIDSEKTKDTPIKSSDHISQAALLEMVGKYYSSETYIDALQASEKEVVLKEKQRLDGYLYILWADIREAFVLKNVLQSLEDSILVEKMQNETDTLTTGTTK